MNINEDIKLLRERTEYLQRFLNEEDEDIDYNQIIEELGVDIKQLEKDMKDDKDSSMKIKEVVFPMWQRIK